MGVGLPLTHLFRRLRSSKIPDLETLAPGLPLFFPVQFSGLDPLGMVLVLVLLVISLGIHEAAHAWVAWKCGDSTAKDLGRITLNPLRHIDPFMTILLPGILLLETHGKFAFGGAKPVPVSFHRLRHPWRDMSFVALAGPLSNLLLAAFFLTAYHLFVNTGWYNGAAEYVGARQGDLLPRVLLAAVTLNLLLAVFNLIPIPPLDGSRVMAYLLPPGMREHYSAVGQYGLLLIFGLIYLRPPFNVFLVETVYDLLAALDSLVSLGGRW
jgi:Zn-dependent protease